MNFLTNDELIDVIKIATRKMKFTKSHTFYIEAQIHGPVRLDTDIEVLMVNERHKDDIDMLNQLEIFSSKHNCRYQFIK